MMGELDPFVRIAPVPAVIAGVLVIAIEKLGFNVLLNRLLD